MIQELFLLHHSLILYNHSKSPAKNKEKRHRMAEFVDITASDLSPSVTDSLSWTAVGAISLTDGLAANSTCSVSLRAANKGHLVPTVRDTPEQPGPQKLTPRRRPGVSWPLHPSLWYSKVSTRLFLLFGSQVEVAVCHLEVRDPDDSCWSYHFYFTFCLSHISWLH